MGSSLGGKNMSNIKSNVKKYMNLKGIRFFGKLLYKIAIELGYRGEGAYNFVEKEKSNFSKMLAGERPINNDYVVPLEKILGVPLAKIIDSSSYEIDIDKDDIPFLYGYRYFAYKDNYELYEKLFVATDVNGHFIFNNSDEYDRFFLDYVVEYQAKEAIRYITNNCNFTFNIFGNQYWIYDVPALNSFPEGLTKLIIDTNNVDIFNKVFDVFEFFIKNTRAINYKCCVYGQDYFLEYILNNQKIFESLFTKKRISFHEVNKGVTPLDGIEDDFICINPLLNYLLKYSLEHINKYKNEAIKILKYGISYNKAAFESLTVSKNETYIDEYYRCNCGNRIYIFRVIYSCIHEVEDEEVNVLLKELLKEFDECKK